MTYGKLEHTGLHRSWWARATGSNLLGLPVVAIYAVIGIIPIVATHPAGDIEARERLLWLAVAVIAQMGLCAVALIGGRLIGHRESRRASIARIGIVLIGGAVRGLIVQLSTDSLGLDDPASLIPRMLNSATTVLLWMAVIAILVDGQREFRRMYREAFDRDIAIAARSVDPDDPDDVVGSIDEHMRRMSRSVRQRIDDIRVDSPHVDSSAVVVQQAADAIRDLVNTQLRPLSHRLWFGDAGQPPRVRFGPVASEAISRAPILTPIVLAILTIGMIIGSAVRYGPTVAAVSGAVLIAVTVAYVALSRSKLALAHARLWNLITVPVFSLVAALMATQASAVLFDAGSDPPTIITIILGIPTFGMIVAMAHVTTDDRQSLLEAMADPQAVREAVRRVREREVATYVHNHVKSQLTASALRMREAARTDDSEGVLAAADAALDVLTRPIPDAIMLGRQSPEERLVEVTQAWQGIADVDVDLPDGLPDQVTLLVADVLAEAIANAVRAGGATHLSVTGEGRSDGLGLTITDNGTGTTEVGHGEGEPGRPSAGMGTAWLDSLVPGQWQRERTGQGSVLTVRLPLTVDVEA